MQLDHLWLTDFRSWARAEVTLTGGLTVIRGSNAVGKTNLLEAIGYLATLSSFRGAPNEALVRAGCSQAVVRGEGRRAERDLLVEAEIRVTGRGRVALNRQPVRRTAALLDALRVSVFSPDDLVLVKGPPSHRRRWLDDALVALHPRNDAIRRELERVIRQRTALLGQAGGRPTADVITTLDVWDTKLVEMGEALASARVALLRRAEPLVAKAYADLADAQASGPLSGVPGPTVTLAYEAPWREQGLAAALAEVRTQELRRGVSLVGPHRDDVALSVGGMTARTKASQGEQRSLALALRLAAHLVVTEEVGEPPVLLLDDVFSELDADRSRALFDLLPPGQSLLTTAGPVPEGASPERVLEVVDGVIVERGTGPERPPERSTGR
ncbi:MAG: DNA replication/repair protein RecF [Acidimicrobiales bacterium]